MPVSVPPLQQKGSAAHEVAVPFAVQQKSHHQVWELPPRRARQVGLALTDSSQGNGLAIGELG